MKSNVKAYSKNDIYNRATIVTNFNRTKGMPLLVGIRSQEDEPDAFDDKFYLFDERDNFILVTSGTTNAGVPTLLQFEKVNTAGACVIKSDEFYPRGYINGLHRGRMKALRQSVPFKYFRDDNRNRKSEQIGKELSGIVYANFHTVTYLENKDIILDKIGWWSSACMVANNTKDYRKIIRFCSRFSAIDFLILQEW